MKLFKLNFLSAILLYFILPTEGPEAQAVYLDSSFLNAFEYRCIGPNRGGRATSVAGIASNPHTYYMGATGGGVWKTDDSGISWKNVSDGFFSTPSIGAIRVAPSNDNRVYVGTGSDGIRSNVITGKGMYRSDDAGKKWSLIGLEKCGQIGAVEVHPIYDDTLFVAAIGQAFNNNPARGVYRSYDAGKSWKQILFHSDSIGAVDLELCPNDPNTIYATLWRAERKPWTIISGGLVGNGIYKSTDGGNNWKQLKNGLPDGLVGKIDLAVTPSDPNVLVALVEAPQGVGGVYVSKDKGETFEHVSDKKELIDRPFYYCNIDVNPQNPRTLYVNATRFWKSTDGGKSWKSMRTPHGDNHDMWINPSDSLTFVQCNDGGANVTHNGGKTWSAIDNQPTAELYQVAVDDQIPYWLYAGQQDNSTISLPSVPPYSPPGGPKAFWTSVGGCETGPAIPKPGNPNIVYANCKGRFGVYNKLTGQEKQYYVGASNIYGHNPKDLKFRFQRVSPIHVSPHNPDAVYHTSQYVHRTFDDGVTWEIISPDLTAFTPETQMVSGSPITRDITGEEYYSTIYAIRESKLAKGQIWVGANDGPVHVTVDDGANWKNVTPSALAKGGRIDCVEPSPHNSRKGYFAGLRYQFGDWHPYIYRTNDLGENWTLLSNGKNGIPADYPTRVVREDPVVEGLLFAGTEFGLFISFDDGKNWQSFQQNLPVTPITDIKVLEDDLVMSTMGRSFWILDNIHTLREAAMTKMAASNHLFEPHDTYMLRYRGNSQSSVPHYPSPGVEIDYYLSNEPADGISVDILNQDGTVVRTYKGSSKKKDKAEEDSEPDMATGFRNAGSAGSLKVTPGLHRMRWDMSHTGSWDKNARRNGSGGPRVSPGSYTARLTVDGKELSQQFELKPNPKTQEAGTTIDHLVAQEQLSLRIRDLQSDAKKLAAEIETEMKEVKKKLNDSPDHKKSLAKKEMLEQVDEMLNTKEGRYHQPMLLDQLRYLSSMLNRADQMPGKDAQDRYAELVQQFADVNRTYQGRRARS